MRHPNIFPDCPKIAQLYNVTVIRIANYRVWRNCFFVKITGIGWRFVSKRFTRKVVKRVVKKPVKPNKLYRIVRMWNQPCWIGGDHVQSVLVQCVTTQKQEWIESLKSCNWQRDQIVRIVDNCLVKSDLDYAQAVGLY